MKRSSSGSARHLSREEAQRAFSAYATSATDSVSEVELRELLKDVGVIDGIGEPEYEAILQDTFLQCADADGNGVLSFDEFYKQLVVWDATNVRLPPHPKDAPTSVQKPVFDASRFQPLAVAAIANFIASIWEDVFDQYQADIVGSASEHSVWENVGVAAAHCVIMLLLCTVLRCLCWRIPTARVKALMMTTLQILAGWGANSLLYYTMHALQSKLAADYSYCEAWLPPACFFVCVSMAVLMVFLAFLTSFLPSRRPPNALNANTLRLHLCALVSGMMALPLGYSWHIATDDLLRTATLRAFSTECDDRRRLSGEYNRLEPQVIEWIVHSSVELAYAVVVALFCAFLKRRMQRRWSAFLERTRHNPDIKKSAAFRAGDRTQVMSFKTFEFVVAWAIFDVTKALYTSVDASPCYPSHGGGLAEAWPTLLVYACLCLGLGLLRACELGQCGLKALERCLRAPPTLCAHELPAIAWGIVLNTLGIQLGWSVHGFYAALEAKYVAEEHERASAVALLSASLVTLASFVAFHVATDNGHKCNLLVSV